MRTVLAGDIGGTKCRFALVSEDFGVHAVRRVPTVRETGPFIDGMARAVREILAEREAVAAAATEAVDWAAREAADREYLIHQLEAALNAALQEAKQEGVQTRPATILSSATNLCKRRSTPRRS